MSVDTTCAPALSRSGRSPESCGIRMAASMPSTAIVRSSSINVSAARCRLVQTGCFDARAAIGSLDRTAAEQLVLLLQQLLDFAQLAQLVGSLLDRIGKRRLPRLGRRSERAVKT